MPAVIGNNNKWLRLWRTLRHLRPIQIFGRLWFRLYQPRPNTSASPEIADGQLRAWVNSVSKPTSFSSPSQFTFLNQTHLLQNSTDWNNPEWDKLWLYNLHYFDYLNAAYAENSSILVGSLIDRWVLDNPPGYGNGWEPYPTSLRIINWIKWEQLLGNSLEPSWQHSLAIQTRYLSKRLEYHLLGNHLFENAKALIFSGLFFKGVEAESWLNKGLKLLSREIDEQVLDDGGHFERSPMYHAIILEDILDLINIFNVYENRLRVKWNTVPEQCRYIAGKMLAWLDIMSHPDGDIALFNDAAFGIAPNLNELVSYSQRLGLSFTPLDNEKLIALPESGYRRYGSGNVVVLMDIGEIGPDHLPAHAHADTLSFELSAFGQRVIVNSGTSCYGISSERLRQRGTAAHNTVTIDAENSSEVWSGFRVARRAKIYDVSTTECIDGYQVTATHNGYKRLLGSPVHTREWRLTSDELLIKDSIAGKGLHLIEVIFHIHPEYLPIVEAGRVDILGQDHQVIMSLEVNTPLENISVESSTYHPEFGLSIKSYKIIARLHEELPITLVSRLFW